MDESQKVRTSAELKEKVKAARNMQQKRYTEEDGVNCNAQMNTALIQRYCQMDKDTTDLLKETCEKYGYSARVIKELHSTVGIVGARRCTVEIRKQCAVETEQIIKTGATVVSGLAKGIDG